MATLDIKLKKANKVYKEGVRMYGDKFISPTSESEANSIDHNNIYLYHVHTYSTGSYSLQNVYIS